MGTPNYPKDMASEWQKVKRDIKNTFTSANSRPAFRSITQGVLDIFNGLVLHAGSYFRSLYANGNTSLYIGQHEDGLGNPVEGMIVYRPNGSLAFWTSGSSDSGDAFWSFFDKANNIIFSDDSVSGQGLARPWLPYTFVRTTLLTSPVDVTTSTTYVSHHTIVGYMQHPRVRTEAYVASNDAPFTDNAQIRLFDPSSGTVIAESVPTNNNWVTLIGNHVNYTFGAKFTYDLQIKRTSGTGNVGTTLITAHGIQSP